MKNAMTRCVTLLCCCVLPMILMGCPAPVPTDAELEAAYAAAVADAKVVEPDEISKDLIAITEYNDYLYWSGEADGRKVLAVTWTSWDGYDAFVGQTVQVTRDVWVTMPPELEDFCADNLPAPQGTALRIEQLMGLPPHGGKTRFVEFWVDPDDLFRPSPDPEITDHEAELDFPVSANYVTVNEDYRQWFIDRTATIYGEDGYPWTRLGYTYDWGNPCTEIGLSEFVIRAGATVQVNTVSTTEEYCALN